jgi:hypothetical protein
MLRSSIALLLFCTSAFGCGILQIKDGYFWDPALREYFIPHGFAYQTFNPPVGANQTLDQLAYDLTEFKKLQATSARVEMVWSQVETAPGVFTWSEADYLVAKADELGLRLFVLIGFQYAPPWFPGDWTATNNVGGSSVVVNYEHPQAQQAYSNFVYQVAKRYKDSPAIGAWILGNEYSYFDLWNTNRVFLGYDPISQASYRSFLAGTYSNNITALNSNWGSNYTSFSSVVMATDYPPDRNNPSYYDLIQWRKKSIADYVAIGAQAARHADPNHLLSYSMVGGVFVGYDSLNTCEDAKTIVSRCAAVGAPLSFWSINNYGSATLGSEMRAAAFGIAKHQAQSGLPVLLTETGHSSSDDLNPEAAQRYSRALPTQLWEALVTGAMGIHIFTWNDRDLFSGPFLREKGFGIVNQNRTPKEPAYSNIANTYRRMANLGLAALLPGSTNPAPDIQFLWTRFGDMVWPRANLENALLWGALSRIGYQSGLIDEDQFDAGAATNAPALLLSRCWMMNPAHLDRIVTNLVLAGVNVHASTDLPGQYNAYHVANPNWTSRMNSLFGLNVASAYPGFDSGVTNAVFTTVGFSGMGTLGGFSPSYSDQVVTWKVYHGIPTNSGTIVRHNGSNNSQPAIAALQVKNFGSAKAAFNSFPLGDIDNIGAQPPLPLEHKWDFRSLWLKSIYSNYFGLQPRVTLTGPGTNYIFTDYRICRNGSVLIGLLNGGTNSVTNLTLTATNLLRGKTVENLTSGGIVKRNSDGVVTNINMTGDDYLLLYAYSSSAGMDQSLLNSNPNKLWISNAPAAVWPTGSNYNLVVGYDLQDPNLTLVGSFERVLSPNLSFAQATNPMPVSATGSATIPLLIPDADPNNPWYVSSRDGGDYVFHAWLLKNGVAISDTFLPVRLLWPVHPLNLPATVTPGAAYQVAVEWQELPSWLPSEGSAPLDRAVLWQPYLASQQYYKVVLELRSAGLLVASQEYLLNSGSGQHTFTISVPQNASGPFTWRAYLQTVPNASVDMVDSFEDRDTGEGTTLYAPWIMQTYPDGAPIFQNAGVTPDFASDGHQAVFMVLTNPPNPSGFAGCFLYYNYAQPWALPHDASQWTNYTFAFDFKEANGHACVLELQVKDGRGGLMNFTKTYTPGAGGWDTIQASLAQFTVPSWLGHFDPTNVSQLLVNIQLLDTSVQYLGYLDNIRFAGPETAAPTVAPSEVWDSFDDRVSATGGGGWNALLPWSTYVYPTNPPSRELDRGAVLYQGINGGQAAMMVVTNPANVGPISTFGLFRYFTNIWALPANTNLWTNYVFSYSFREAGRLPCSIEMQIKSDTNSWIEFKKTYTPDANGWDTVRASLAQFVQPSGIGQFDPTHVEGIALNVRLSRTGVIYVGFFDNAWFDTPNTIVPSGTSFGIYQSSNDSVPDNTPVIIQSIHRVSGSQMQLSWQARSNRLYTVEYQDIGPLSEECFLPLFPLTNLWLPTNGPLTVTDTNAAWPTNRFYRLRTQPR